MADPGRGRGMRDLIVTGAGGRLGRLLRAAWQEDPPDALRPVWTSRSGATGMTWDIRTAPPPGLPQGADILHLAGVLTGSNDQLAENAAMIPPLLDACAALRARRLWFISSAAVYGPGAAARESDPPAPANPYGTAKLAAERQAQSLSSVPLTILRLGNVVGADALLGPRPAGAEIILDPVPGRDGGPVRSWIGPRSLARLLARLMQVAAPPPVLNLALDPPLSMSSLLEAGRLPWRYGPERSGTVPTATLSLLRLQALVETPAVTPDFLAAEAAWARAVLA